MPAGLLEHLVEALARLRLGMEVGTSDDHARQGMVDDIEEMDRIISQFLDFARNGDESLREVCDPGDIVATVVARHRRTGRDVRFARGELPSVPLRATAFERLVGNLLANALRHGAPPVDIATRAAKRSLV